MSAGELRCEQGFRWVSVANTATVPDPVAGTSVVHRSPDGKVTTAYESLRDGVRFHQPADAVDEVFYVVEGTITCTLDDGTVQVWRTGDLGYRSTAAPCEVAFSDGLRVVRFRWSRTVARAAPPAGLHVFGDQGPMLRYHGAPVSNRVVHESADGRVLGFYGVLPEGVAFTEVPADLHESFYVVQGSIRCRPEGGPPIVWQAGDLVYWPYDRRFALEYSVGLGCVCFFWSDERLPDFTGGAQSI